MIIFRVAAPGVFPFLSIPETLPAKLLYYGAGADLKETCEVKFESTLSPPTYFIIQLLNGRSKSTQISHTKTDRHVSHAVIPRLLDNGTSVHEMFRKKEGLGDSILSECGGKPDTQVQTSATGLQQSLVTWMASMVIAIGHGILLFGSQPLKGVQNVLFCQLQLSHKKASNPRSFTLGRNIRRYDSSRLDC